MQHHITRLISTHARRPFWRLLAYAIRLVSFAAVSGFAAGYFSA